MGEARWCFLCDARPFIDVDCPHTPAESETARDAEFTPGNDGVWGAGNWVKCDQGCTDDRGQPAYHSKLKHA